MRSQHLSRNFWNFQCAEIDGPLATLACSPIPWHSAMRQSFNSLADGHDEVSLIGATPLAWAKVEIWRTECVAINTSVTRSLAIIASCSRSRIWRSQARHTFFHVKTARFVRWHHSLPTFGSEIALSARMSAPSFASPPQYAFTLTKTVAVPAAILFRSISMAAARICASGAPTNVAFPPSPIHLLTAYNNDWLTQKYSNISSIRVSWSTCKNTAKSGRFEFGPSSSRPTLEESHW